MIVKGQEEGNKERLPQLQEEQQKTLNEREKDTTRKKKEVECQKEVTSQEKEVLKQRYGKVISNI